MFKKFALAAVAMGVAAVPASAVVYDAFTSFDGTQHAGGFTYGTLDTSTLAVSLFGATTNCFIDNSVCLQSAANHDVPGATKSTTPSFQYGSVNVPTDRLLVHPGSGNDAAFVAFTFPTTHLYRVTATFNTQDTSPTGVNILGFYYDPATMNFIYGVPVGSLAAGSPSSTTYTFKNSGLIPAGIALGFAVDKAGNYGSDSTGVNFTVQSVPEPATWAMMIGGFGLVGAAARRRRSVAAAACSG